MTSENGEATIAEIRQILGYFQTLRDAVRKPLPELNAGLWEQAKQEATVELLEELRRREHGMTLRPSSAGVPRRPVPVNQHHIDSVIERRAESKYPALDATYNSVLKERQQQVHELVKMIDHFMTPLRHKIHAMPEAAGTLLATDWREIRERFSINEIMAFDEDGRELYDRTIQTLEAIERQLIRKNGLVARIWRSCLDILGVVFYAFFKSRE